MLTLLLSPPCEEFPQVTIEPSFFSAAKALLLEKSWVTPEDSSALTLLLSPPLEESPQVMTEPSYFSAAKACDEEKI